VIKPQELTRAPNQIYVPIPYKNPKLNWEGHINGIKRWAEKFGIKLGEDYGFGIEISEIPESIEWHTEDETGGFLIDSKLGAVKGRVGVVNRTGTAENGTVSCKITPGIPVSTSLNYE